MANAVATTIPLVMSDTEAWSNVASFEDAVTLLQENGIALHSTTEFGDGFTVLEDKAALINVPFIITGMKFSESGDFGEFVIIHLVTKDGRKHIITDGSTGIYKQCKLYADKGIVSGLMCEAGLIVSEYTYTDDKGQERPAKTYYLP